mgnify:CR=1 FL=1
MLLCARERKLRSLEALRLSELEISLCKWQRRCHDMESQLLEGLIGDHRCTAAAAAERSSANAQSSSSSANRSRGVKNDSTRSLLHRDGFSRGLRSLSPDWQSAVCVIPDRWWPGDWWMTIGGGSTPACSGMANALAVRWICASV